MIRLPLFPRRRPGCPQCQGLGFKQVRSDFWGQPVLRCQTCSHEWTSSAGKPDARGTDRRPA